VWSWRPVATDREREREGEGERADDLPPPALIPEFVSATRAQLLPSASRMGFSRTQG